MPVGMDSIQAGARETIAKCLTEALFVIAGGSFPEEVERKKLRENVLTSISFPNKKNDSNSGKPHDIEVRLALSFFHRLRRMSVNGAVEIISDMGVTRHIDSPRELADRILLPLESACRKEGVAHDVRSQPSGLISIVTVQRSQVLRREGKLPCPLCTKWCQGTKGLWWHHHQNHKVEYSDAAEFAASSTDTMAIVPYDPDTSSGLPDHCHDLSASSTSIESNTPLEHVKTGNLKALRQDVENGYRPAEELDAKGASSLMWAAGSGHLNIVRYLQEECGCDPNQSQQGKRSFSGRTSLHWAARNGHLEVVEYLVLECHVDLEAATSDGTTAFCWASWQGQIAIMKFLRKNGCNIHSVNSFGCNAVLWAAQGNGDTNIMIWLQDNGCEMTKVNNNGHGVLHKAAQRGQVAVCNWFFETWVKSSCDSKNVLRLIGPDIDAWCPSDLAGMEGHKDLAILVAEMEMGLIKNLTMNNVDLPSWLTATQEGISMRISEKELYTWERFGGVRRMRSRLKMKNG